MKGPSYRWLLCLMAIAFLAGAVRAAEREVRPSKRAGSSQRTAFEAQVERTSYDDASVPPAGETTQPYYEDQVDEPGTGAPALSPLVEGSEAYLEALDGHLTEGEWYGDDGYGGEWYGDPPCLGCGEPDHCCSCDCGEFSGRPAPWFALSEVIFTQRQRSRNRIVSRDRADPIQVISGGQLITIANATAVMGTKSVGAFPFDPGFRFTLGRYLGRDMLNRDHTLEFTYFGMLEWHGEASVRAQALMFVPLPGNSSVPAAVSGTLFTDFPNKFPNGDPSVGGFNYALDHYIEYWSHANNFELNYRLRRALGRDSLVACPDGSWSRELTPGHTPSIFGGVRYFELDERFYFLSQGIYTPPPDPLNKPIQVELNQGGEYTIHTRNRLIGAQLGGDLIDEHIRWNWGARGKMGLYANFADQDSTVLIQAQDDLFTVGNQYTSGSDQRLAFIGEIGFVGNYRWRPNVTFHAAWDMMWVQRLALAPEQLNFTFPQTDFITTTGRVFFNTFSVGAEVAW